MQISETLTWLAFLKQRSSANTLVINNTLIKWNTLQLKQEGPCIGTCHRCFQVQAERFY